MSSVSLTAVKWYIFNGDTTLSQGNRTDYLPVMGQRNDLNIIRKWWVGGVKSDY